MKYFTTILLCIVSLTGFAQEDYSNAKGYFAFTSDAGVHPSYFQHTGSTNLKIDYSYFDLTTNKGVYKTFHLSSPFYREKLQFDLGLIGFERNGKHDYWEIKTGLVTGQQGGSAYLTYGMGYRGDLIKNKLAIRIGLGLFYTGMTQDLGEINNQNRTISFLDKEFSNKIEVSSKNSGTHYYDADRIDIYQKYKCIGLKPKIGFELPISKKQAYAARLNIGYNFVFADLNKIRFKQRSDNNDTGTKQSYNVSDTRLNYQFVSQGGGNSPFSVNGLFVNLEVILKIGKVY